MGAPYWGGVVPPAVPVSPRQQLLEEAIRITTSDRNKAYGNPEDNFKNIAEFWESYLNMRVMSGNHFAVTAMDVANMMILMKMARLATNPTHRDSLLDIAGYAACGADIQASQLARDYSQPGDDTTRTM